MKDKLSSLHVYESIPIYYFFLLYCLLFTILIYLLQYYCPLAAVMKKFPCLQIK